MEHDDDDEPIQLGFAVPVSSRGEIGHASSAWSEWGAFSMSLLAISKE